MKKAISILLVALLAIALVGCSSQDIGSMKSEAWAALSEQQRVDYAKGILKDIPFNVTGDTEDEKAQNFVSVLTLSLSADDITVDQAIEKLKELNQPSTSASPASSAVPVGSPAASATVAPSASTPASATPAA